ncbi:hypothetical protein ABID21_002295 [Pseudorhizobium tarimense]|uniref:DUF1127 domain-containing protein n=1 Tax=Pseudorhizobium tarimense TaxID=1079109 RepID=A0ABV2H6L3_9HYPH
MLIIQLVRSRVTAHHTLTFLQRKWAQMSILDSLSYDLRKVRFYPPRPAGLLFMLAPPRRPRKRIDLEDLSEDVLRDIGLRDGRSIQKDAGRRRAWREALFTFPPRSL